MSNDGYIWPSQLVSTGNAGENMDDASDSSGLDQDSEPPDSSDRHGDYASSGSLRSFAPGLYVVDYFNPSELWEVTSDAPLSDATVQYRQRLAYIQHEIGQIIRERRACHQALMEREEAGQATQLHDIPRHPFLPSTSSQFTCYPSCCLRARYDVCEPTEPFVDRDPYCESRCPFYHDPRCFCISICTHCWGISRAHGEPGSLPMPVVDDRNPNQQVAEFDSQDGLERSTADPMAYLPDPLATGPAPPLSPGDYDADGESDSGSSASRTLVASSESAYTELDPSMYLCMNSSVSDPDEQDGQLGDDATLMFRFVNGRIVPIQPPDWPPLVDDWEEDQVAHQENTLEEVGIRLALEFLQRPKTSHDWVLACSCSQSLIRNCREVDASEAPRLDEAYQDVDDFILWCIMHIPRLRHRGELDTFYFIVVIAIIHVAHYTGHDSDRLLQAMRSLLTVHDRMPPTDEDVIEAYWGGIYIIHQLCWNERLMQSKRFSGAPEPSHTEMDRLNWAVHARSPFEEHSDGIPAYQCLNWRGEERLAFPVLIHHLLGGDTRFHYEEICEALLIWHDQPWQHLFWQPPTYEQFADTG